MRSSVPSRQTVMSQAASEPIDFAVSTRLAAAAASPSTVRPIGVARRVDAVAG